MSKTVEDLRVWRKGTVEAWKEESVLSKENLDGLVWFYLHSYADYAELGVELRGYSVRESAEGTLLVLKVSQEGIPRVAFVSSLDTMCCIRKLQRLLRDGELRLFDDKYA